ncbi:MAG: NAD(P)/FAD-dependent oxidoreductase [Rhodospirillales bacterium]|nr:NAD(P)/FAD-dependent oxidoreductase [Rhodospirillales bacterium]
MPKDSDNEQPLADIANAWLSDFENALTGNDQEAIAALFLDDGHWRDILAFSWDLYSVSGPEAIAEKICSAQADAKASNFHIPDTRTPPRSVKRAGTDVIEVMFDFKTGIGTGSGIVRLRDTDEGDWRAWTFSTTLQALDGYPETTSAIRAGVDAFSREWGGENWLDFRNRQRAYKDHDPAVLVVGGGQAGLGVAARLTHLGVDTLIVDKYPRIGDNWRTRYHSLTLHNEVYVNHMPYMPFPSTWPVYIPKDMLANWFEHYVEALELNYWAGTEMTEASYDDAKGEWTVTLKKSDGTERIVRPRHVIMATGASGIPIMPELPGMKDFKGEVMHSGWYETGHKWEGKKALVIGTGNSAHDVAQDLHACGVETTMVQRSSTHIVSLKEAQRVYLIYAEGPPVRDCDLIATSMPFPVLKKSYKMATAMSKEIDKPLLDKLSARGFKLNDGVEDCGFQMSYLQRGGGYYFNVGCSDLIANGDINILQYDDIDTFCAEGAKLKDGSVVEADLIVMATGYKMQQETVRQFMGDDVADKVGPVWGFNDVGELNNMWCRTPQPGLWFTAGSLAQCRIFSRFLALQIKALEEGLITHDT